MHWVACPVWLPLGSLPQTHWCQHCPRLARPSCVPVQSSSGLTLQRVPAGPELGRLLELLLPQGCVWLLPCLVGPGGFEPSRALSLCPGHLLVSGRSGLPLSRCT